MSDAGTWVPLVVAIAVGSLAAAMIIVRRVVHPEAEEVTARRSRLHQRAPTIVQMIAVTAALLLGLAVHLTTRAAARSSGADAAPVSDTAGIAAPATPDAEGAGRTWAAVATAAGALAAAGGIIALLRRHDSRS